MAETLIPIALEHGVQVALAIMWIVVLGYGILKAPTAGKAIYDLMIELNGTVKDNTELLTYTKNLHDKMETTGTERHEEVTDKLETVIAEIRELRELRELDKDRDEKTNLKLERIEHALTKELEQRRSKQ